MAHRKVAAISIITVILILSCSAIGFAKDSWRYLKSNVHAYQNSRDIKASYAVWTNPGEGHLLIPVNTKVKMKKWRRGFVLLTQDNKSVYYNVDRRRAKMTGEEYFSNILTSSQKTNLSKFSKLDRKGIAEGKVTNGMTRKGVRIAFGYPSPHATPDIKGTRWIFWKNRFGKTALTFDANNKVINIK